MLTRILRLLSFAALAAAAHATPTGLNNIPTADTTPQGTFVFQTFGTMGGSADTDLNFGFKTGLDLKIAKVEIGSAAHLYPDKGGPVTVHGKVAVPFGKGLPVFAIGAANVAFSEQQRARAGEVFGYAVLSQDFGWLRVHAGCGWQDADALPFFGVDKTFRLTKAAPPADGKTVAAPVTRDLFTVRADAIELRSHDWLFSAGVFVPVCKHFVFEAWGNFPSDGDDPSLTLKANFVFSF